MVRNLDIWAGETAALIAQGTLPEKIASRFNFTLGELDDIMASSEFAEALATHGDAAVETFAELQSAQSQQSARRFLKDRLAQYLERLDQLVMAGTLKPEKQAEDLLQLVKFGAPKEDALQEESIRLSPATMDNIARRTVEYQKYKEAYRPSADSAEESDSCEE